jgi:type 1 glutamine amidotransferase
LLELGQGVVVLHHGLLAYPDWDTWDGLTGMKKRVLKSYHPNELVSVEAADLKHPILQGQSAWRMIDETYVLEEANPEADPANHIILTTANLHSMRPLAWTRQYRQSRVFCFACGHGYATFNNPAFRQVLANGIRWTANALT